MNKLSIFIAIAAIIIIGFFWLNNQKNDESLGSKERVVHEINYAQIKVFDPVYIALDQGYFDDEGLVLNLKGETFGGPQALMSTASGEVDAGIAATTAIINAVAAGVNVKGILDVQSSMNDSALMKWYVLEDSIIKNPNDLRGKKIGVNTLGASFHYTVIQYLKDNNISENEVEFLAVPHGNLEQALRAKQIDVAGMIDPFSEIAYDRGGLRILFTAMDVLGENQFSLIFMSERKMLNDPEAVRKFSRAYKRAVDFINNNPEQAAEIIANIFEVDKKYISQHKFQPEAQVREDDINYWLEFMKSQSVPGLEDLTVDGIGTNEFNQ
jgi:ABC-type nitrate/sulfonate/bicarbonate transport system substrate-binding protein